MWLALGLLGFDAQGGARAIDHTGYDAVYGEGVDVVLTDAPVSRDPAQLRERELACNAESLTARSLKGWHGELVFVRHPKEEKTRNPVYEESLPYVFGKVNAHHALRVQRFALRRWPRSTAEWGDCGADAAIWGGAGHCQTRVFGNRVSGNSIHLARGGTIRSRGSFFRPHLWSCPLGQRIGEPGVQSWPLLSGGEAMSFEFHDSRTTTRTLEAGVQLDAYVFPRRDLGARVSFAPVGCSSRLCCDMPVGAQWSSKGLGDVLR